MNFEQLQNQWQQQKKDVVTINTDILLTEVKRNKESFESMIFWRDVREVGIALALVVLFLYLGMKDNWWPLYLMAAACLFVSAFFVVDRYIQKRKQPQADNNLQKCVQASLAQVNHQIWLLKNVFWWYLLPFVAGGLLLGAHAAFRFNETWEDILWDFSGDVLTWGLLSFVIWWINQYAVKKGLIPRKEELEELLTSIESSENNAD